MIKNSSSWFHRPHHYQSIHVENNATTISDERNVDTYHQLSKFVRNKPIIVHDVTKFKSKYFQRKLRPELYQAVCMTIDATRPSEKRELIEAITAVLSQKKYEKLLTAFLLDKKPQDIKRKETKHINLQQLKPKIVGVKIRNWHRKELYNSVMKHYPSGLQRYLKGPLLRADYNTAYFAIKTLERLGSPINVLLSLKHAEVIPPQTTLDDLGKIMPNQNVPQYLANGLIPPRMCPPEPGTDLEQWYRILKSHEQFNTDFWKRLPISNRKGKIAEFVHMYLNAHKIFADVIIKTGIHVVYTDELLSNTNDYQQARDIVKDHFGNVPGTIRKEIINGHECYCCEITEVDVIGFKEIDQKLQIRFIENIKSSEGHAGSANSQNKLVVEHYGDDHYHYLFPEDNGMLVDKTEEINFDSCLKEDLITRTIGPKNQKEYDVQLPLSEIEIKYLALILGDEQVSNEYERYLS